MRKATTPRKRTGTRKRKRSSTDTDELESSTDTDKLVSRNPGLSLKTLNLNPERRRAAKSPTDSEDSLY
jgi:hypothetical protein